MNTSQIGGYDLDKIRKADACFAAGSVMWLSGIAILFVLISWAAGGQAFFRSFYGAYFLSGLAAAFVFGAVLYGMARKRAAG